jgi:cytochrome c-type biogenesis protein
MEFSLVNIALTLGAGFLSVASPCVLPIIPIITAGTEKDHRYRPLFIVSGLTLTFILMGIISSSFSFLIEGKMYYIEKITGILIVLLGIAMILDFNPFEKITFFNRFAGKRGKGNWSGFALGATLGLIWIPCIGPLLSGILAMVAANATLKGGIVLLAVYSLGFSIPILTAAYFTQFFRNKISLLQRHPFAVHLISGCLLIILGGYIFIKGMVGFTL